jgi:hypothetical protein
MVSGQAALIFSADPLAAALLGALVELAGHTPCFPAPGEAARAALRRIRPRVALVDCDHDEACSDAFIGPALMTGAAVLLIRAQRTRHDPSALAERLSLPVLELPAQQDALMRELEAAFGPAHG